MKNRCSSVFFIAFFLVILSALVYSGGMISGWLLAGKTVASLPRSVLEYAYDTFEDKAATPTTVTTEQLFTPFWQTWKIVHDQYVDKPVNDLKLMQGAIRGMLESLGDPHTSYMDPDEYQQQNAPLEGEYQGIGAWVDTTGDYVAIISPMPDSPAEKANLKPGDLVIGVDGEDMTGIDGNLVLRKILGPADTYVTLTISRKGEEKSFDVKLQRAKIVIPSVQSKMLDNNIAYIELLTFAEKTDTDLEKSLNELLPKKPKGLILDMRNNGGGYLNTAIDVVSEFIGDGVVMIEDYGDGRKNEYKVRGKGLATEIPLVILVNGGSASASEITAGAIQDYKRGKLVGEKTYGKGSVQNWIALDNEQGAVRITVARWLTPSGRQINKKGLEPDVVVPFTDADFEAKRDPQLDKAIEILSTSESTLK